MPSTESASASWPALQGRLLLLAYAGLCLAYLAWGGCGELTDLGGDSAAYMLAARQSSPFLAAVPAFAQALAGSIYPPLFPLAIGLFGGGFLAAHLLVVAALLGALACFYRWLREEGVDAATSAWVCAVFALMPGTYLLTLNIWTENPYLLFSLLALLAARRAAAAPHRAADWWTCAAAVAAASLVRAAALPLLAAFLIYLLRRRPRRWFWMLAAGAGPFGLWALWSQWHRSGVAGYAAQWSQVYAADPLAALRHQLGREAPALLHAWVQGWLNQDRLSPTALLVLAIGIACLAGCAWRLRRLQFDAIYTLLYLGLILVWPFPAEAQRLSYVIVPLLLAQGLLGLRALLSTGAGRSVRPASLVLLAACSILLAPSLLLTFNRFRQTLPPTLAMVRHDPGWYGDDPERARRLSHSLALILADLRRVEAVVPPADCIYSIKPSVVSLYTRRLSLEPPQPGAAASFEPAAAQCRFAYLLIYNSPTYPEPFYPYALLRGRSQTLWTLRDSDGSPGETFAMLLELQQPEPASR